MGTKDFNALDLFICRWRSRIVRKFLRPDTTVLDFGCGHQALFLQSVQQSIRHGIGLDYVANCPMAKADWLQRSQNLANPYYAEDMKECGTIVRRAGEKPTPGKRGAP